MKPSEGPSQKGRPNQTEIFGETEKGLSELRTTVEKERKIRIMEKRKKGVLARLKEIGGNNLDTLQFAGLEFHRHKAMDSVDSWNDNSGFFKVVMVSAEGIIFNISIQPPHVISGLFNEKIPNSKSGLEKYIRRELKRIGLSVKTSTKESDPSLKQKVVEDLQAAVFEVGLPFGCKIDGLFVRDRSNDIVASFHIKERKFILVVPGKKFYEYPRFDSAEEVLRALKNRLNNS